VGKRLQRTISRTREAIQKIRFLGDLFFLTIFFFLKLRLILTFFFRLVNWISGKGILRTKKALLWEKRGYLNLKRKKPEELQLKLAGVK